MESGVSANAPVSRRKRIGFWAVMAVLLLMLIEASSLLLYRVYTGRWFSYAVVLKRARQVAGSKRKPRTPRQGPPVWLQSKVVHPYLGYVEEPRRRAEVVSPYGFRSHEPVLQAKSADKFLVGVFGGSLAMGVGLHGHLEIVRELERSRRLAGRTIKVLCLAIGGYKQPQQLQALSLLLALGGQFDAVVNLDGFNELVLPLAENAVQGSALFYPRGWPLLNSNLESPEFLLVIGHLAEIDAERRAVARALSESLARYVVSANLAWTLFDRWQAGRAAAAAREIEGMAHGRSYLHTGPPESATTDEQVLERSTALWIESSVQMNRLAQANGILYAHFLQPNQYLEGSKPLSDEEKRIAISHQRYGPIARRAYPLLVRAGSVLAERGVPFTDLTRIFAEEKKTLYVDDCCHVNDEGYERLGAAIGATLRERLDSSLGSAPE